MIVQRDWKSDLADRSPGVTVESKEQSQLAIAQADRESVRSELWNWLDKHPGDAAAHDSERLRLVSATRASHQQPVANP